MPTGILRKIPGNVLKFFHRLFAMSETASWRWLQKRKIELRDASGKRCSGPRRASRRCAEVALPTLENTWLEGDPSADGGWQNCIAFDLWQRRSLRQRELFKVGREDLIHCN